MKHHKIILISAVMCCLGAIAAGQVSSQDQNGQDQNWDDLITGHGTLNFIPKFNGTHTIGNSVMFQAGANVGVGTTKPQATLDVETSGVLGILGSSGASAGNAFGVFGQSASSEFGAGVLGKASAPNGTGYGVYGESDGTSGNGVFGYASATSGNTIGISGFVESPSGTAGRFVANAGSGLLLQGVSGSNQVVFSVDAAGNAFFAGNLIKGSGSFKIDHPLDPANKYLSHSFVESPDMMDVYNGLARLDAHGSAWVQLPDYFEALNGEYRYQLTAIGAPAPNLYVAKEVSGNRFKIAGGKPGGKVSWQLSGIRHDAYANAHRIAVEEQKPAEARGQYLHPELFGVPKEQTVGTLHPQVTAPSDIAKGRSN